MTTADILNAKQLCEKYEVIGLFIDIEFNRYGMILRGRWDWQLNHYDFRRFNRTFEYDFLCSWLNDKSLESLIDEFKKEFEHNLKFEMKLKGVKE